MKQIIVFALLLSSTFALAQPTCTRAYGNTLQHKSTPAYPLVDVQFARLVLALDPAVRYLHGQTTLYFSPKTDADAVDFELQAAMQIDAVYHRGQLLPTNAYTRTGNLLHIGLGETIDAGKTDSVTIHYQGIPTKTGDYGFYNSTHSGTPIAWTLSEPYGGADWWPCQHTLSDKIDSLDVLVQCPDAYRSASNGLLTASRTDNGLRTDHWKHRAPIAPYLVAFAVTNYVEQRLLVPGEKNVEIMNLAYPESATRWQTDGQQIIPIMQLYNELWGIYPFASEKYGHAQFSWSGGMEHQTMGFMVALTFGLQAHELAHQWFGDYVTCGSWTDIWLNEGFATYNEGLCYEHGLGTTNFKLWLRDKLGSITSLAGGSIIVDDTTSVDRVFSGRLSYDKGAMVLHQLRRFIGDDAFFSAIRNYLADVNVAAKFASTPQLRAHFERTSGISLQTYFDQWVYGQGFPRIEIQWATRDNLLRLRIRQQASIEGAKPFSLKLPITIGDGQRTQMLWVPIEAATQTVDLNVDMHVNSLSSNENYDVIAQVATPMPNNSLLLPVPPNLSELIAVPNPAHDSVEIFWNDALTPTEARLFTAQGKCVWVKNIENLNSLPIDTSALDAGNYVIQLKAGNQILKTKIMKIK